MKKTTVLILILFSLAFTLSCRGMIGKVKTSLVTVKVSGHTAMLDIRPATLAEKTTRFLARALSLSAAYAGIPSIVQDLRLTVSATDMTTITATVNVVGLMDADFMVEVPNGTQRHFVVEGLDSASIVQYNGEAYSDLIGDPVLLTINMAAVSVTDTTAPVFGGVTSATVVSSTDVMLSWSPATDNVTSQANIVYLIYQATSPSGEIYTTPTYTTTAGATSYTVTGLTPGTTYYFVVRARDEAGNIDSNTIERTNTTPDTIAPVFAGLSLVSKVTLSTMDLSWAPATDNVTPQGNIRYLIYRTTSPGGEVYTTPTDITTPGATTYTATGLFTGTNYYFVVRAQDGAGNIDTNTAEFSGVYPTLFVSALTGTDIAGCGTPATPCQTITQALSLTTGTEAISVATGTYLPAGASAGETFPLQLKPGTSLLCLGPNHTTVIDASPSGGSSPAISGNTGASIDGCRIFPNSDGTAINDQTTTITINNVVIDEQGSGNAAWDAVVLTADSLISNSTILGAGSSYILVDIGNPTIKNNTLLGTDYSADGISVNTGNPTIQGNIITTSSINASGSAISISTGTATIDSNTISWGLSSGAVGITINGGASVITGNTVTGNSTGLIISGGTATISNNIISSNTTAGISISSGTPIITGNTINLNGTGISVTGGLPSLSGNSIYCSTTADLMGTGPTVNLTVPNNSWDHDPPTTGLTTGGPCLPLVDICQSTGSSINATPNSPAVLNGCTP